MIQNYRRNKIIRYLDSFKNQWRHFPPSLHIELTDECFNNCVMCKHWKRKEKWELNVDTLLSFLTAGVSLGLEGVCYTGGDPLCHPDINRVMRWHIENDVDFGIVTAGFIPKQVSCDLLKMASWIRVSLDAVDNKTYAICRGGPTSFDDVNLSIRKLMLLGANVELGVTVHRHNINHVGSILAYAMGVGIHKVSMRNVYDHAIYLRLEPSDTEEVTGIVNKFVDDLRLDINWNAKLYRPSKSDKCYACLYQWFIRANGDVHPCCILAGDTQDKPIANDNFGNIYHNSHNSIMYNAMALADHRDVGIKILCDRLCIERLDTINIVATQMIDEKNFF